MKVGDSHGIGLCVFTEETYKESREEEDYKPGNGSINEAEDSHGADAFLDAVVLLGAVVKADNGLRTRSNAVNGNAHDGSYGTYYGHDHDVSVALLLAVLNESLIAYDLRSGVGDLHYKSRKAHTYYLAAGMKVKRTSLEL